MTWAGNDLHRPICFWDPTEAEAVRVPQRDPRADAVRLEDLSPVGRRIVAYPAATDGGYDC